MTPIFAPVTGGNASNCSTAARAIGSASAASSCLSRKASASAMVAAVAPSAYKLGANAT